MIMKRSLIAILCLSLFCTSALAQQPLATPEHAAASARVMKKFHQVMLIGQLLPILFNKDQWNSVLEAVEKTREQVRKTQENEYNVLVGDESILDDMIDAGLKKEQEPDLKKLTKFETDLKNLGITRQIVAAGNVETVMTVVKKVADVGQLHEMEGSLNIHDLDPSLDPKTMSEDDKLRFFIKSVLLDPDAYELMVKISIKASPAKS